MTSFQPATENQTGHIGARQTRVEDAALLRGLGCYADDAAIPAGTLQAAIIRSPRAHARITSVDYSKALLMKGVHGVLVGAWALERGPAVDVNAALTQVVGQLLNETSRAPCFD